VVATGAEVIEPVEDGKSPAPGKVIEFNSRVLAAQAREWGADVAYLGRCDDDAASLANRLRGEIARHEMLCVIAGSSAGRKDITVEALRSCGEIVFHGVDVVPGRPAALACVDGKPVLAVPGYPVSAFVVYCELLRPAIDAALGRAPFAPRVVEADVRSHVPSRLGVEELVRVCLAFEGDTLVAAALPRGASMIGALVRAHGIVRIGPTTEGVAAGARTDVELFDAGFDPAACIVAGGRPDSLTAALAEALASGGTAIEIAHLGRAPHDAHAALELGEAHLVVIDVGDDGDVAQGERAYRVDIPGRASLQIRLSAALMESDVGARVTAAIESTAMLDACERHVRVRPVIERGR
jgi:putative molybdopterin biosynthesis protein